MEHHSNAKQRVKRTRKSVDQVRTKKVLDGENLIAEESKATGEKYNLGWFKPSEAQRAFIETIDNHDLTLSDSASGTGKSTTAIWYALRALSSGHYRQIVFIKTPSESTDDQIGYLPNSAEDKISVHLEATRTVFRDFMSKAKLEIEEKRERIILTIPNFIQGKTLTNCLVIIDESQSISPPILKLLIERCGEGSKYIVLGDRNQCYSAKKRENGLKWLIDRVTYETEDGLVSKEPLIGYHRMVARDNMRSELSKRIVEIYEGDV